MYQYNVYVSAPEALLGQAGESPTLASRLEKIICLCVCIDRTYVLVLVLITLKSLPTLILCVLASFINSKTVHKLISGEETNCLPHWWQQQGGRPLVELLIQWLEQYWLPHGIKVSSADTIIWVAISPLTLEVTCHMDRPLQWPHQWTCHKRLRECHLSVDTSQKAHGVLDPCECSNHRDHAICEIAVELLQLARPMHSPCAVHLYVRFV